MYVCVCKRTPRNPRHPGDFGDIGDIFRKSLKLPDFLQVPDGDIPGDIFGDGDLSPSSQSRADTEDFPKWKRFGNTEPSLTDRGSYPHSAKKKLDDGG